MTSLNNADKALIDAIRDEFNAQPIGQRLRNGRFMTLEAISELLRELQHAEDTVARIESRIATILEGERRREHDAAIRENQP